MDSSFWYLSVLIILFTILLLIIVRHFEYEISKDVKYLASAIGISGFMFAILSDDIFAN